MSPKYKLTYFNLMGLAEPIRLVFAYAGVEFEDVRVTKEDWPNIKSQTPWGHMPILEEDGNQLSQSVTILRYVGRKYGLAGEDEFQTAKCDEYIDAITDFRLESTAVFREANETKKAEIKKKLQEENIPKLCQKLDAILKKNGTGFLVGNNPTYADIFAAHFIPFFIKYAELTDKDMQAFPAIMPHRAKIFNLPGIKEWVATRPVTEF